MAPLHPLRSPPSIIPQSQHHRKPPRLPLLHAVREKETGTASRTYSRHLDVFWQQTGQQQLLIIGLPNIQAQARTPLQLLRREHRRLAYLLAILLKRRHLVEFHLPHIETPHLFRNFITTCANRRSNTRVHMLWSASKLIAHSLYRGKHNTACSAAPTTVRQPDRPLYRVI